MLARLQTEIDRLNAEIAECADDAKNGLTTRRNQLVDIRDRLLRDFNRAELLLARKPPDTAPLHRWIRAHLVAGGKLHAAEVKMALRSAGIFFTRSQLVRALEACGIETRITPFYGCSMVQGS